MIDVFECSVWNAKLTPSSCAARWAVANGGPRGPAPHAHPTITRAIHAGGCDGCHVGQQHRGGILPERWPDGSPVVRLQLAPRGAPPSARPAVRPPTGKASLRTIPRTPDYDRRNGRPATVHTQDGLTLTFRGWAHHLLLTPEAFRVRVVRYGIEQAIQMGRARAAGSRPRRFTGRAA